MKILKNFAIWAAVCLVIAALSPARADTFFYTGPNEGDFFDESNWSAAANGSGASPAAGTIDPGIGVLHSLILDGDNVTAAGTVDVGSGGSLDLQANSELNVFDLNFTAEFQLSTGGSFFLTDAALNTSADIQLRGTSNFSGGTVESFGDDIEFFSSDTTINGTMFTSDDSTIIRRELTPAVGSSIVGATFVSKSRLGIQQFDMTVTDTIIQLVGDLEDVTTTDLDSATGTLTLLGSSSLTADQVQEGVRLILDGSSVATLTNQELEPDDDELSWLTQASTRVTLNSPDASLVLVNEQLESSDMQIFNGVTGVSYSADPSTWDPIDWNGTDGVTLSITSTPPDPDFNGDSDVDGADFLTWQRGFGLTGQVDNSNGDANGNGTIDAADLAAWESQFGSGSLAAVSAVPEPASGILVLIASLGAVCRCGRRSARSGGLQSRKTKQNHD